MNTQPLPKLPVKEVVYNAVLELTGGDTTLIFTNRELKELISRQYPDFKTGNVDCELRADCVNHPKHDRHFPDRINYDYYWRVSRGQYRLYDPETDTI
jgi:mRNA-degrading endonuclease RelE of RelBE toxin-antitoxin system